MVPWLRLYSSMAGRPCASLTNRLTINTFVVRQYRKEQQLRIIPQFFKSRRTTHSQGAQQKNNKQWSHKGQKRAEDSRREQKGDKRTFLGKPGKDQPGRLLLAGKSAVVTATNSQATVITQHFINRNANKSCIKSHLDK